MDVYNSQYHCLFRCFSLKVDKRLNHCDLCDIRLVSMGTKRHRADNLLIESSDHSTTFLFLISDAYFNLVNYTMLIKYLSRTICVLEISIKRIKYSASEYCVLCFAGAQSYANISYLHPVLQTLKKLF